MMPSRMRPEGRSLYNAKFGPGASTFYRRHTTLIGGPTTSRVRIVVVAACCSSGSELPSSRLLRCVRNFERPAGRSFPLLFECITFRSSHMYFAWVPRPKCSRKRIHFDFRFTISILFGHALRGPFC